MTITRTSVEHHASAAGHPHKAASSPSFQALRKRSRIRGSLGANRDRHPQLVSIGGVAPKVVGPATSPSATTGKPLIAYELDRFFRADRHPPQADLNYSRAEAGRILLAARAAKVSLRRTGHISCG
jgi:hypothetical protein